MPLLVALGILAVIFPIIGGIKASNGEDLALSAVDPVPQADGSRRVIRSPRRKPRALLVVRPRSWP